MGCLKFGLGDSPTSFKTFQIPWLGQMMILELLAWVLDPSFDTSSNILYIFMVILMLRLPLLVMAMSSLVWLKQLYSLWHDEESGPPKLIRKLQLWTAMSLGPHPNLTLLLQRSSYLLNFVLASMIVDFNANSKDVNSSAPNTTNNSVC